jgi:hypothetical protein
MTSDALHIRWRAILLASISVLAVSFVLVAASIFAYGFSLGWAARGAPDFEAIQRFANAVGPIWGPRLGVLFTGLAALWIGRRADAWPAGHGMLVGLIVAAVPLVMRPRLGLAQAAAMAIAVGVGALGGWLGGQMASTRTQS